MGRKKKEAKKEEPKLNLNEEYCFKCKRIVWKRNFNPYYKICTDCERKSTGH